MLNEQKGGSELNTIVDSWKVALSLLGVERGCIVGVEFPRGRHRDIFGNLEFIGRSARQLGENLRRESVSLFWGRHPIGVSWATQLHPSPDIGMEWAVRDLFTTIRNESGPGVPNCLVRVGCITVMERIETVLDFAIEATAQSFL